MMEGEVRPERTKPRGMALSKPIWRSKTGFASWQRRSRFQNRVSSAIIATEFWGHMGNVDWRMSTKPPIGNTMAAWITAMVFHIAVLLVPNATLADKDLYIDPVIQDTHVWCWVAVGEMVFEHFGVDNVNPGNNFQCGIVGTMAYGTWGHACWLNCYNPQCIVPATSGSYVKRMLEEYPRRIEAMTGSAQPNLRVRHRAHHLSRSKLISVIDDGEPIIAGISPSGRPPSFQGSEHVALIVGYEDDGDYLIVNDPYPFPPNIWANPYTRAGAEELEFGQYRISYRRFKGRLQWAESFIVSESK